MAKQHYVTRRITTTKAVVLAHNVETNETAKCEVILPRAYKNDNEVLAKAREIYETDTVKIACVLQTSVDIQKYVMTEEEFVKNAFVKEPKEEFDEEEFDEEDLDEEEETEE